ncbi:putative RING-H2 finger protein ATL46-like [Sesbania bispinosa]|nr:putative RING-H2 finger protein ATL46-like [Sesbania bispinosa]
MYGSFGKIYSYDRFNLALQMSGDSGISAFPVRPGKFRRLDVEAVENGGETSSSNLDARCYSIWMQEDWSNKGKFSVSSDAQMGMPSSLSTDLPWMRETAGT